MDNKEGDFDVNNSSTFENVDKLYIKMEFAIQVRPFIHDYIGIRCKGENIFRVSV